MFSVKFINKMKQDEEMQDKKLIIVFDLNDSFKETVKLII